MEFDRRYRYEDTGEIYYDEGLWRGFKNVGSKLASKLMGKTAKKLASTAAEKLVTKGSEKIGEKTGQLIGEKIYDKFSGTKPTNENKGEEIVKLLQQQQPKQEETDKFKYVKDVYHDLLL